MRRILLGTFAFTLLATLVLVAGMTPVVYADSPVFPIFDGYPKQGCYGYVVGSTGMYLGSGTISVNVPGPVVDAWLIWQGVNDTDDPGNPDTTSLDVNGQTVVGQMTDHTYYSIVYADQYQWVANVGPSGYDLVSEGPNVFNISEWWPLATYKDGSGSMDPRRAGVSLIVIYDRSPCSDPVEIVPYYGVDFIWWQGNPALDGGPLTENHVFTFDASPEGRQAHLVINFSGVGQKAAKGGVCRETAVWAAVGSGTPPDAVAETGYPGTHGVNGGILVGENLFNISPPCTQSVTSPLVDFSGGFVGDEWSTVDLTFDIGAGDEWLAVQLESVVRGYPPPWPGGESGAWTSGVFMIPLPPPDVTVFKADGVDLAAPGDVLTYTVEFSNQGPGLAQGVIVTDVLPMYSTFLSCTTSIGVCTESGGVVTIEIPELLAGESGTAEIVVQLDPVFPAGTTTLTNTATISTITQGDDPTNNTASDTTDVFAYVSLDVIKVGTPEPVDAGANITYTLTWSIGGNAFANNVMLTDTLPDKVTFVAASDGGIYNAGTHTVMWTLGNLLPGDMGTVVITGTVHTPLPNGLVITNTAHIEDASGAMADVSVANTVRSDHELHITKDGPAEVDNGSFITYTMTYSVTGNEPAPNVVITDLLPAWVTYVSGGDVYDPNTRVVTWTLGDIDPPASGNVTLVVQATGLITDGMVVTNTVTISDDDVDTPSASDAVATTIRSAAIEGTVFEDRNGNGIQDAGESGISGAQVCISPGLFSVPDCQITGSGGNYRFDGREPGSYTVILSIWPSGYITTTPASVSLTVLGGETGRVDFGVTPPAVVEGVVFDDANGNGTRDGGESGIPGAGVCIYVSGSTSPLNCTTSGSDGTYRLDNLFPGMYTVQLSSWPSGYENTTPVSANVSVLGGETGRVDFGLARPDYEITKAFNVPVGTPIKVEVGDRITFTIQIENTGGVPLTIIPLNDTFDSTYLRFVSASPAPDSTSSGTLTWNDLTGGGSLAPGSTITVQVVFEALAETSATNNVATASGVRSQGGQTLADKSASLTFSIQAPTAVTMANILAEFNEDGAIVLTWVTAAEFDNWGFNVYRAEASDPDMAVRLNTYLIPARGQAVSGATYHFVDSSVRPGTRYWYWIEAVDMDGQTTWYGPVEVFVPEALEPGTGSGGLSFLPLVLTR